MDFREWQAGYGPELAEIKVQATLDLARAAMVAREVYAILAARERNGFGVWRMVNLGPSNLETYCLVCGRYLDDCGGC